MATWIHVSLATFKNENIDLSVVTSVATWIQRYMATWING